METVICYLLFVTQKIRFWKLSTVTPVTQKWFMETVNCQTVTPVTQKFIFGNCQLSTVTLGVN